MRCRSRGELSTLGIFLRLPCVCSSVRIVLTVLGTTSCGIVVGGFWLLRPGVLILLKRTLDRACTHFSREEHGRPLPRLNTVRFMLASTYR